MTEVLFYHLQGRRLEGALPPLLEKSLERGWRVIVQAGSEERIEALDALLWSYRDDSFLPHATARAPDADEQPICSPSAKTIPTGHRFDFCSTGSRSRPMPQATSALS